MTTHGAGAYQARLDAFAGAASGEPLQAPDEVNAAMIRHWCDAIGDDNPIYTDPERAASSAHGGIVAPPTMLQAWVMRRLDHGRYPAPDGDGPSEQLTAVLAERGFTSVVATNSEQTYARYLRLGDRLSMRTVIDAVGPEKSTALGSGHFVTTRQDYSDASGELVGSMRFRILRFRPPASARGAAPPTEPEHAARPARPAPAINPDNAWWFDALDGRRLLVRRCATCGLVKHPPQPMCPRCNGLRWDTTAAGPRGVVHSFVRVHHPQVEAFEYPLDVLLVDVEVPGTGDTVRMLMNRGDGATTSIGDHVRIQIRALDGLRTLPVAVAAPDGAGDETVELDPLQIPLTRTLIVATAIASRDYQEVHHDPGLARERGSQDIIMNILTTNGFVGRYVTDWAGPDATIRSVDIRLGAPNYPGDTMTMTGSVEATDPATRRTTVRVTGTNGLGTHVSGTVEVTLP